MKNDSGLSRAMIFFWAKHILMILLGCFFLIFGLDILVGAYSLHDPFTFVLTFFASNFIILISATLIFIFAFRLYKSCIHPGEKEPPEKKE